MEASRPKAKISTPSGVQHGCASSSGLLCDDGPRARAGPVLQHVRRLRRYLGSRLGMLIARASSSRTCANVSTMPRKRHIVRHGRRRRVPRWRRCRPPGPPARRTGRRGPARRPGNASTSSGSNVHRRAAAQSTDGAAPATRSGQPSASAIGSRMSGGDAWAIVAPSTILDHRVDHRLRVDDDVDPLVGHPEQQVRLDHLESLVDESRRVRGDELAHVPGRMRAALRSGSLRRARSRRRPRNGPPLAVRTSRATSSGAPAAQALGQRGVF